MSRNENLHQRCIYDGLGDGGELFRVRATALVERGWTAGEVAEDIKAQPWRFAIPPDWDDKHIQREIESCGAVCAPKLAAKKEVTQVSDDGLPGWLRARIEALTVPVDCDRYFHDVVAGLACRGWDRRRITVEIAGRPWMPKRYATGHALEWGVQTLLMAVPLSKVDDAEPDANAALPPWLQRSSIDEAAPDGLRPPAAVIAPAAEDAVDAWIRDRCERDASSWESSAALFASWTSWAKGARETAGSQRRFAQALEGHGFQDQRKRHGRGFLGLRIIPVEQSRSRPVTLMSTRPPPPAPHLIMATLPDDERRRVCGEKND